MRAEERRKQYVQCFWMYVSGSGIQFVNSSLHVFLCRGKEETRQWRGSEGESRRSEVTLECLGNNREAKKNKNKGRRESPVLCLCVSAAAGHLSLGATLVS